MADLTSTITISGSINGRKINHTHTYTMEDVYDAGTHDRECVQTSPTVYNGMTAGGNEITFVQDTPNYFLAINPDSHGVAMVNTPVQIYLTPRAFLLTTGTAGLALATASATSIAVADVTGVTVDPVAPFPPGSIQLMVAFNSVS